MRIRINCCSVQLDKTGRSMSPNNMNGDKFTCPSCRKRWEFIEDEAEGGGWFRVKMKKAKRL